MLRASGGNTNMVKRKGSTILLFAYGVVFGTSAPFLLSRCAATGSDCGKCGGFCGLALGIVPLLLYFAIRGRMKRAGRRVLSLVRKTGSRQLTGRDPEG